MICTRYKLLNPLVVYSLCDLPGQRPARLVHDQEPNTDVLAHCIGPVQRSLIVVLVGLNDAVAPVHQQLHVWWVWLSHVTSNSL